MRPTEYTPTCTLVFTNVKYDHQYWCLELNRAFTETSRNSKSFLTKKNKENKIHFLRNPINENRKLFSFHFTCQGYGLVLTFLGMLFCRLDSRLLALGIKPQVTSMQEKVNDSQQTTTAPRYIILTDPLVFQSLERKGALEV